MSNRLKPLDDHRPSRPIAEGTRIGHVHLKVADLERALSFYCGVLGFELTQRRGSQAAFVSAGGYHHHVGLNTWATHPRAAVADEARLIEWTLRLPAAADVAATGESLVAAGFRTEWDEDGGFRSADPWGIVAHVRAQGARVP